MSLEESILMRETAQAANFIDNDAFKKKIARPLPKKTISFDHPEIEDISAISEQSLISDKSPSASNSVIFTPKRTIIKAQTTPNILNQKESSISIVSESYKDNLEADEQCENIHCKALKRSKIESFSLITEMQGLRDQMYCITQDYNKALSENMELKNRINLYEDCDNNNKLEIKYLIEENEKLRKDQEKGDKEITTLSIKFKLIQDEMNKTKKELQDLKIENESNNKKNALEKENFRIKEENLKKTYEYQINELNYTLES